MRTHTECRVCGMALAKFRCRMCGAGVCSHCFDQDLGVCFNCKSKEI